VVGHVKYLRSDLQAGNNW